MKKQVPLGYSPAYSYPTASRTPQGSSNGGGGGGRVGGSNLPGIFLPRPKSGLKLDIQGLHGTGPFHSNGGRERSELRGLASSDSAAERIRQAQKYHALHTPRHHTSDGRLLHHQRGSHPIENTINRERALIGGLSGAGGGVPTSIVRRQPSATLEPMGHRRPGTLPPIGAESEEGDSQVTTEKKEEEEESVFGDLKAEDSDEAETDSTETDSDDEVIKLVVSYPRAVISSMILTTLTMKNWCQHLRLCSSQFPN